MSESPACVAHPGFAEHCALVISGACDGDHESGLAVDGGLGGTLSELDTVTVGDGNAVVGLSVVEPPHQGGTLKTVPVAVGACVTAGHEIVGQGATLGTVPVAVGTCVAAGHAIVGLAPFVAEREGCVVIADNTGIMRPTKSLMLSWSITPFKNAIRFTASSPL